MWIVKNISAFLSPHLVLLYVVRTVPSSTQPKKEDRMKIANTEDRLLLRVEEAALRLGIGRSKTYDLINAHVIPSVRIGRSLRVPV